ncbi:MAG: DmsE family decaheme c-type cytochrome [Proteobacteria bacterium]|nr:DmsE family decaheme c-type cytochrome [Pseudomonadota bacterium]MBU1714139.1 DmsE family decaheme c-type cytochrome [Pseudomonadota bacterium]
MDLKRNHMKLLLLCGLLAVFFIAGCNALKKSTPIVSITEYEKMLLGKITSDYVGNANCLVNCHDHDKLALDFKSSTMGDQLAESSSGMMIVDCESCHGPGSELMDAIKGLDAEKDAKTIVQAHKENLLDFSNLPAGALSLICLKCHTANATFNIHNWNGSVHALNGVTCSNCHPIHAGSDLIAQPREVANLCLSCHIDTSAQFSLPSHHPVKEGKIYCSDCHDPHGNSNPKNLREMTQKETCGRCHTEKTGPFLYEHSDITEECTTCHNQHGSINDKLLKLRQPFLCKQCHPHHRNSNDLFANKSMSYTRCTDCHSMVHGTDTPGANSAGAFTR